MLAKTAGREPSAPMAVTQPRHERICAQTGGFAGRSCHPMLRRTGGVQRKAGRSGNRECDMDHPSPVSKALRFMTKPDCPVVRHIIDKKAALRAIPRARVRAAPPNLQRFPFDWAGACSGLLRSLSMGGPLPMWAPLAGRYPAPGEPGLQSDLNETQLSPPITSATSHTACGLLCRT